MTTPDETRRRLPPTGNIHDADQLWSIEQVAEFLNLPVGTIRKQRVEGKFAPGYRIGKHVRWKRSELLEWLEEHRDEE